MAPAMMWGMKRKPGGQPKPEGEKLTAPLLTHWRPDDLEQVRAAAEQEGRSMNELVTEAGLKAANRALRKLHPLAPPTPATLNPALNEALRHLDEDPSEPQPTRWQPPEHRRRKP